MNSISSEEILHEFRTIDRNTISQLRFQNILKEGKFPEDSNWWKANKAATIASWKNKFSFTEEIQAPNGSLLQKGLRTPQLGAIYSALSHWTTSKSTAVTVMPTGTGKTETMLSLLIKQQIDRLLVIVPSDNLRKQIGNKFISLGELKKCGIIDNSVLHPVVGRIFHKISTIQEADLLWQRCHVVVTTLDSLNACSVVVRQHMAESASYVFVDEAHHSTAPTWRNFLDRCVNSRIMLFTATPFREDGKRLEGKLIYTYPLALAQKEGYFRHIDLYPIRQFNPLLADLDIAAKAVEVLNKDLENGLNHIIMARVNSIPRAKEVLTAYEAFEKYKPIVIHSKLPAAEKAEKLRALTGKESRIAICVNMLGEGFDLPELKIAAIHDGHQSWPVFLQFIGRFIRNRTDLGDASVIINEASQSVSSSMKALYKPDSDWNSIIRFQSQSKIKKEIEAKECHDGFTSIPFSFTLDQLFPKTSVVIYQLPVSKTWNPENCVKGFRDNVEVTYCVNSDDDMLLICAKHTAPPEWTESNSIQDVIHDLFAVYYDKEYRLIFLHSSNTDSYHENVAKAIGAEEYLIINNDQVFRCFDGIFELRLFNVGLSEAMGTQIRYTMHVGPNVREGLTEVLTTNKSKANLFGTGTKDGKSFSIGASYKGRIWSRFQYDLTEFKDWCKWVQSKVIDNSIDTAKIIKNVWMPEVLTALPEDILPFYVDWPEDFYKSLSGHKNLFRIGKVSYDWCFVGIHLIQVTKNEISFVITIENYRSVYSMTIKNNEAIYELIEGEEIEIRRGHNFISLRQHFRTSPVLIRYADLSYILNTVRYCPPDIMTLPQFDLNKIISWDWTGTNIKKESQKLEKRPDSIQRRVILELLKDEEYSIVFDDDDSGEAADIIAIKEHKDYFSVDLFHLKFSKDVYVGSRIDDLYTVCGQSQRSGIWQNPKTEIIKHMRDREVKRKQMSTVSRFERGDINTLFHLQNQQRNKAFLFSVAAVQPGLSKAKITDSQLLLLGTTEMYLMQAYKVPFRLIVSA